MTTFEYQDYKTFIIQRLEEDKKLSKSGLAKATQCQSAYISQVLNGNAHFSLEQMMFASSYLELKNEEQDYVMDLLQFNRAGTKELKDYFKTRLEEKKLAFLNLSKRIENKKTLTQLEQSHYYSNWIHLAVHMATTLVNCKNVQDVVDYLQISTVKVNESLDFLIATGIIEKTKNGFQSGKAIIHLNSDSPLVPMMHLNMRQLSSQKIHHFRQKDFSHNIIYSSLVTLSVDDFSKIKDLLIKAIQSSKNIIKPSREETMCVFNIDFFEMK